MKNIKALLLIVMLMAAGAVSAQYTQEKPNVEYMFKIEAGYLHKVANYGKPQADAASTNIEGSGFRFNLHEEAMGLNIINGINISQDFFLGGGVGYAFCAPMRPVRFDKSSHMAVAFIDMDFRPVGDTWAPMVDEPQQLWQHHQPLPRGVCRSQLVLRPCSAADGQELPQPLRRGGCCHGSANRFHPHPCRLALVDELFRYNS